MPVARDAMSPVMLRRAEDRAVTRTDWLDSRHSFAFGAHYQPDNTGFGLLLVNNDDRVAPGTGFDTHPHRDMEIVTWVLDGALVHQDSAGHVGAIYPGLAQRMSAGTGIRHSEKNDGALPVHFVQMWVAPDTPGVTPGYEQRDIGSDLVQGTLVVVASGRSDSAIRIHQRDAEFSVARLSDGGTLELPSTPYVHVFVALGAADLEGSGVLRAGDVARISNSDGRRICAVGPAEILVWAMWSAIRG